VGETLRCELVSCETVYELAYDLARKVSVSGFAPDLVVAIARGGFTPARVLCDVLGIFNLTSIRVVHYRAPAATRPVAVLYPLCVPIEGQRVLVVDDVNDSGDTLRAARIHLESLAPAQLRTAVLHEKVGSNVRADYAAGTVLEWRWLVYPWAVVEDVGGFLRQMDPPPADAADADRRLREGYGLELPPGQLERLLALVAETRGR